MVSASCSGTTRRRRERSLLTARRRRACAVTFSIFNAVLLRQLPYPKADRVVEVKQITPNGRRTNLCDVNFDAEVETAYE